MTRIGKRIKRYRKELGLTQFELEKISGVEHSRISRIENGAIMPDIAELSALSKALDCEICDLVSCGYTAQEREFMRSFRKLIKNYSRQNM